jgi:hypothetical protein|tara:strand:+ start:326 stop:469 length:144 start_codon:yes stop_codon:yes gene_type:complete
VKVYLLWNFGVIAWNFGFPNVSPFADVIAAVLLSLLNYKLPVLFKNF